MSEQAQSASKKKIGRPTRSTHKATFALDTDAYKLLEQLAPKNTRSAFLSQLIRREAVAAGLLVLDDPGATRFDLAALQEQLRSLQDRVSTALEQQTNMREVGVDI